MVEDQTITVWIIGAAVFIGTIIQQTIRISNIKNKLQNRLNIAEERLKENVLKNARQDSDIKDIFEKLGKWDIALATIKTQLTNIQAMLIGLTKDVKILNSKK